MHNSRLEFFIGIIVLVVSALFVYYAMSVKGSVKTGDYMVKANFSDSSGIIVGSEVKIAGVTVGKVKQMSLDPETFRAVTHIAVQEGVVLPTDTSAKIVSESLLGGKFIALYPGIDDEVLESGDMIGFTQSSLSFEEMLSKLLFGLADGKKDEG